MASETSELTFVRCQTCRSLVPATASRCRICNATLETASKPGAGEASGGAARVRQKTVSASPDEVANLVTEQPPQSSSSSAVSQDDDEFDPLGAYLQDLDSSSESPSPASASNSLIADKVGDDPHEDLFDAEEFENEFLNDPPAEDPSTVRAVSSPPAPPAPPKAQEPVKKEPFKKADTTPVDSSSAAPSQAASMARPPEEPRATKQEPLAPQSDKAQQRDRMQPQRSAQGPMRPKFGGPPQPQQPRQDKPQQAHGAPNRGGQGDRSGVQRPGGSSRNDAVSGQKQPQQSQHQARPPISDGGRERVEKQESQRPVAHTPPRPGKIAPGRLFGWLVSYENPDGRAIELRAGKFFITGTMIRGSDLILEDHSISTPHALVSISEKGFMLQDLMSERGTFVRSTHDTQYRREEGIIEVHHGDWIRFGDVEFLVTIVPNGDLR